MTFARSLSCQAAGGADAVNKLRSVIEEYRSVHYTQEIPTRFKKDLVKAAVASSKSTSSNVKLEGMQNLLANIGAKDRVSNNDLQTIFAENANEVGEMSPNQFMKLL